MTLTVISLSSTVWTSYNISLDCGCCVVSCLSVTDISTIASWIPMSSSSDLLHTLLSCQGSHHQGPCHWMNPVITASLPQHPSVAAMLYCDLGLQLKIYGCFWRSIHDFSSRTLPQLDLQLTLTHLSPSPSLLSSSSIFLLEIKCFSFASPPVCPPSWPFAG